MPITVIRDVVRCQACCAALQTVCLQRHGACISRAFGVQVPWKMYSSKAAAAQSFAMRRLRLNLPGASTQLWSLSFR